MATAIASSSKTLPALAFDGKEDTQWTTDAAAPGWLGYAFAGKAGKTVCRYDLTSAVDLPQCDPMNWEFQASADGEKWITLDVRKNQLFVRRNQTRSYLVNNHTDYPHYRLNVLATREGDANANPVGLILTCCRWTHPPCRAFLKSSSRKTTTEKCGSVGRNRTVR